MPSFTRSSKLYPSEKYVILKLEILLGGYNGIPKDLRDMDEEQFRHMFEVVRNRTENFTRFTPKLFVENNQFLLILRCSLGLSRTNFARKMWVHHRTLCHVECGHKQNKISGFTVAERWTKKTEKFLKENSSEIDLNKALIFWRNFKFKQFGSPDKSFIESLKKELRHLELPKDLREIDENKFIALFNFLKQRQEDLKY